jgi:hypothetical protein
MTNSTKGRDDELEIVPLANGHLPESSMPTIAKLLVAGNEKLPNGAVNDWNAKKSLKLIREYDPAYETDDESAETTTSRKRRLKIAQCLGLTGPQLSMGAMTMTYV